jgi:hypothetical protein
MKISFIASRYKESIFLDDFKNEIRNYLPLNADLEFIIYDKFEFKSDSYKLVENIGRESYAWFDYVINTWDNPSDYYAFIHLGMPNSRLDKFNANVSLLSNIEKMLKNNETFCWPTVPNIPKKVDLSFSLKGGWVGSTPSNIEDVKRQYYKTSPHKNLREWWISLSNQSSPHLRSFAGMCCAKKENLHSWGLDFWKKIYDDIIEGGSNGEISHFVEKSMLRISEGSFR